MSAFTSRSLRLHICFVFLFSIKSFAQNPQLDCSLVFERQKSFDRLVLDRPLATYEEAIQELSNRKNQLMKQIEKMPLSELTAEAQNSMNFLLRTQNYLPGCTPEWTVRRVEDLISNFHSSSRSHSMLHQVSVNLGIVEMIDEILKKHSGILLERHKDLIQLWNTHVWHYHVLRVLEDRLS